jgi:DnaK suppressor protein
VDAHTPEQLAAVRADLFRLRQELLTLIADETGATDTVELDQSTQGRLSRMDAIQHQQMAMAQCRRAAQRLERVDAVLAGWDDPDLEFGCCRFCEDPIALPRLHAKPDAISCVDCANARERR